MPNKHTGKEYGFEFLIRYLQDHFKARTKYEELPDEYIDEVIEITVMNNHDLFSKQYVIDFDGCKRCGRCCLNQKCNKYDKETKLCTDWDNRTTFCRQFPWDEYTIYLDASCQYVENFFKDNIEFYLNKKVI